MILAHNKPIMPQVISHDNGIATATSLVQNNQANINLVAKQILATSTTGIYPKNQKVPHAFAQLCSLSKQKVELIYLETCITDIINILQPELDAIYPPYLLKLLHALAKMKVTNSEVVKEFIILLYRTLCKYLADFNVEDLISTAEAMMTLNALSTGFIEAWLRELILRTSMNGHQLLRCYTVLDFLEEHRAASPRYPVNVIRQQLQENLFCAPIIP